MSTKIVSVDLNNLNVSKHAEAFANLPYTSQHH